MKLGAILLIQNTGNTILALITILHFVRSGSSPSPCARAAPYMNTLNVRFEIGIASTFVITVGTLFVSDLQVNFLNVLCEVTLISIDKVTAIFRTLFVIDLVVHRLDVHS
jgi:hypothetical protein